MGLHKNAMVKFRHVFHFVKEYIKHTHKGEILWGRRVMLGENVSNKLLINENVEQLGFTKLLFSLSPSLLTISEASSIIY